MTDLPTQMKTHLAEVGLRIPDHFVTLKGATQGESLQIHPQLCSVRSPNTSQDADAFWHLGTQKRTWHPSWSLAQSTSGPPEKIHRKATVLGSGSRTSQHPTYLADLLRHIAGPHPLVSSSSGLGWRPENLRFWQRPSWPWAAGYLSSLNFYHL